MIKLITLLLFCFLIQFSDAQTPFKSWKISDTLIVHQITKNVFIHQSKLFFDGANSVDCNGLIYSLNGIALMADTPSDSATTAILIQFVKDSLKANVRSVMVSHFHIDALGGLDACHAQGIGSYGYTKTPKLAKKEGLTPPIHPIKSAQTLIGGEDESMIMFYPGQAHSKDNMVMYIPAEKVLFGSCMVKCVGANYGNLADANMEKWEQSVENVKVRFPDAEIVVPGHGAYGRRELLDYTQELIAKYQN